MWQADDETTVYMGISLTRIIQITVKTYPVSSRKVRIILYHETGFNVQYYFFITLQYMLILFTDSLGRRILR